MPTSVVIIDAMIPSVTPTFSDWFSGAEFLSFESNTTGEYVVTGQFIEVNVALFAEVTPGIIRLCKEWVETINTIDLIRLPEKYRNDCFPMRLLINPSSEFHARIIAISC
ncbi:hypothetical protein QUB29_19470 [Microcoleus sp. B4b_D2]|uniref:hypothetical protein n=1 Tax=Microcoleus sp. B4b_D2 TaxID=3055310 RepID=UPI002FD4863D